MSRHRDDGPIDLVVLCLALAALAAIVTFAAITGGMSSGPEPTPLPTAPTTVAP
jgi:hypothetical protein